MFSPGTPLSPIMPTVFFMIPGKPGHPSTSSAYLFAFCTSTSLLQPIFPHEPL